MNSKNIFASTVVVAALSTLSLVGCGSDTKLGREVDREVVKAQFRQGPYWTACQDSSVISHSYGLPKVRSEVDYGASMQRTTTLFGAGNCESSPAITIVENGTYEIGSRVIGDAYELNENYESIAITPRSDEGKQALIAANACGTTDWVVGVPRVVTGDTAQAGCWLQTPRLVYDIALRYNSGVQYGRVDGDRDKTAAARRPIELDPARRFDKK